MTTTNGPSGPVAQQSTRLHRGGSRGPVGAVVLGGDFVGLGVLRSLGRRGLPVCVIDDERSIARFSRYATWQVTRADLSDDDAVVAALLGAVHRYGLTGWVLYPTRDELVAAVSRRRDELCEFLRVPTPPWETVEVVSDKRSTYRTCERLGIPTPRTWYLQSRADLAAVDGEPPFAVKPAFKHPFVATTKVKAWRADSRKELEAAVAVASTVVPTEQVLVQELVPGGGTQQYACCTLFKDGRQAATMVVQRLRQHPPEFGRASTHVRTTERSDLEELTTRLLTAIDYYGLVEVEFKQDPRNGVMKLLDVNARPWGYHTLGGAAGVDFPYLLYADQIGAPRPFVRASSGVRWTRLVTDLPVGVLEVRAGNLSIGRYVRSLVQSSTESVFCTDDPAPALAELALIPYLARTRGF